MTLKEQAIALSKLGWQIFPIFGVKVGQCDCGQNHDKDKRSIGKHPITRNGFHEATNNEETITQWWSQNPNANIGVATGSVSGFLVLDVDPKNGGDESRLDIPITVRAISGSGGRHYFFKYNRNVKNGNNVFGPGLDCKSDGGYIIVSPSNHQSGGKYEWVLQQSPFELEMAEAPEWMLSQVKKDYKKQEIYGEGERDTALTSLAGKMRSSGATEPEMLAALKSFNKTRCVPPLEDKQLEKIVKSIGRYETQVKTQKEPKLSKTISIMESDENLSNLFRFNLFTKDLEYANIPKFTTLAKAGEILSDNDFIEIKYYLSKEYKFEPEIRTIIEACVILARRNTHHPVRDYILNLKWDGVPRLDMWLIDYCGVEDNEYTRAVARKVIVAAIARVFSPGCKFDFMMILEGPQGIGKSQLVEALGGQWYLDTDIMERSKDTVDKMRGAWIIEISELVGFKKKDVESLKAFISRRVDRERLSYRRDFSDFPRQCIFIGTHNPSGDNTYFYDDTGNRRFWPIKCNRTDYKGIASVRSQLFAEAKILYEKGEKLYLDQESQHIRASQEQEDRMAQDPWMFAIHDYLMGKHIVTGKELLLNALQIPKERMFKESLMKVGRIMKEMGWTKKRQTKGDIREWFYESPKDMKQKCAECGCHIFEQRGAIYVCHSCNKPREWAKTPEDDTNKQEEWT